MVFSSIRFVGFFLPIFLILYSVTSKKYRPYTLLIGSIIFYSMGEPYNVWLLILSILVNFLCNKWMLCNQKYRSFWLSIILVWNIGLLFVFKYFDFFANNLNRLMGMKGIPLLHLALPLGISFYTFQMMAYQIDVYCGKIQKQASLRDFSLYVCMFPQLVAGPIVRFREFENDIQKPVYSMEHIENGLKIFTIGLGYKVLLANQISTLFNQIQGIGGENLNITIAWLGAIAYSFQIYFDFCGYSLMAIGLGEVLGYKLPINFNHPYMAISVTDFWKRWHVTLSQWFRDYVYIPLGGNRKGKKRMIFNLFVVWSLTGLWHGANWNFVIWGLLFCFLLILEKFGMESFFEKNRVVGHLYCMLIIPVSWIIFAQTDCNMLCSYLQAMFGRNKGHVMVGQVQLLRFVHTYWELLILCILFCMPMPMKLFHKYKKKVVL